MIQRPLNRLPCHNRDCPASIEIPEPILREANCYLNTIAMGGDYVAVACAECKLASPYSVAAFHASGMTDTPDPFHNGQLNLFFVYIECELKDCQFLIGTFAPKPSHVTLDDVRAELNDWTVSDALRCGCGRRAVSLQVTSLRQRELESSGSIPD
jgi:hypothetical protein